MLEAVTRGLAMPELSEVEVETVPALAATCDHVLRADGYVLLTPANFGYMSGAMKHFFDTTFYTCLDAVTGRPYALCVHGDDDTAGAITSVERLAGAWGLSAVGPAVSVCGRAGRAELDHVSEAAATVGAHLID